MSRVHVKAVPSQTDVSEVEDDGERPPVKVSFELEISERTLVDQDSDSQTEGSRKGELDVEDPEESVATIKHSEGDGADQDEVVGVSDDDSFVKVILVLPSPTLS